MAPPGITIGGKDSYLCPSILYSISTNSLTVQLDTPPPSKSKSPPPPPSLSSPPQNPKENPKYPTIEESRSILITFLNKLLRSHTPNLRPNFPQFISQTLNKGFGNDQLDVGSVYGFLQSWLKLNDTNLEEIGGVSDVEFNVAKNSVQGLEGIAAIIVHCASGLSLIANGVVGLSIEVVRGDVSGVFKYLDSIDGLSNKDQGGLASDLKILLKSSP